MGKGEHIRQCADFQIVEVNAGCSVENYPSICLLVSVFDCNSHHSLVNSHTVRHRSKFRHVDSADKRRIRWSADIEYVDCGSLGVDDEELFAFGIVGHDLRRRLIENAARICAEMTERDTVLCMHTDGGEQAKCNEKVCAVSGLHDDISLETCKSGCHSG